MNVLNQKSAVQTFKHHSMLSFKCDTFFTPHLSVNGTLLLTCIYVTLLLCPGETPFCSIFILLRSA